MKALSVPGGIHHGGDSSLQLDWSVNGGNYILYRRIVWQSFCGYERNVLFTLILVEELNLYRDSRVGFACFALCGWVFSVISGFLHDSKLEYNPSAGDSDLKPDSIFADGSMSMSGFKGCIMTNALFNFYFIFGLCWELTWYEEMLNTISIGPAVPLIWYNVVINWGKPVSNVSRSHRD